MPRPACSQCSRGYKAPRNDDVFGNHILPSSTRVQYAFNLFSHNAPMGENGYNEEEMKMVKETRKILSAPNIAITATCIRCALVSEDTVVKHRRMKRYSLPTEGRQIPA